LPTPSGNIFWKRPEDNSVLINWFTVLAQIVNFLILIYLLKRFLFKPILRAMAEREKKMAEALNRAEKAEQKAAAEAKALPRRKAAFAGEARETLMVEAREQVARWREDTLKGAKEEVEALRMPGCQHEPGPAGLSGRAETADGGTGGAHGRKGFSGPGGPGAEPAGGCKYFLKKWPRTKGSCKTGAPRSGHFGSVGDSP
jgi:hypothetical protein